MIQAKFRQNQWGKWGDGLERWVKMAPRAVWEFPFKGELGISLLVQCLKTPSSQCGGRKPKQVQDLHHLEENQLKVIYELCIIRMVFAHLALGQSGMTPLLHFISPQITSTFFKTWIFWIPPNKKVALSSEFLLFFIHNSILAPNTVDCKDAFICLFSSQSPNWTRWIAKLISGTGCVLLNSEHLIQNW